MYTGDEFALISDHQSAIFLQSFQVPLTYWSLKNQLTFLKEFKNSVIVTMTQVTMTHMLSI